MAKSEYSSVPSTSAEKILLLYLLLKRLLSRLEVPVFFVCLESTQQDLSSGVLTASQAGGSQ